MQNLIDSIVADGVVDADEVAQLKETLLADGVIDREEAEGLFKINDAVSGNENDPSYNSFFVDAITSHLLEDEETPGVVDQAEGDWLVSKIEGDGEVDDLEKTLLANIADKAESIESEKLTALIASVQEN